MHLKDLDPELYQFTKAEERLNVTARRALSVETRRAQRDVIRELISTATEVVPIVADFEGTDDPYALARIVVTQNVSMQNLSNFTYGMHFIGFLEQRAKS